MVGVELHENGFDINDLENKIEKYKPKLIYVTPTFNNPTGYAWDNEIGSILPLMPFPKHINVDNIADYLMEAFDGFVDIVEIKKPNVDNFWQDTLDHNLSIIHI